MNLAMTHASGALNGLLALGFGAAMLAGCATDGAPKLATCLDDSSSCIGKRQATLSTMMADPNRQWVAQRPSPVVYATGVRLFAWRKSQGELSCGELRSGINETASARATLAKPIPGASRTRIGQIIALSDDINAELKRTSRRKRCPKA